MSIGKTAQFSLAGLASLLFLTGTPAQAEEYETRFPATTNYTLPPPADDFSTYQNSHEYAPEDVRLSREFRLRLDDHHDLVRDFMDDEGLIRLRGDANVMFYERESGRYKTQFGLGDVEGRPGLVFKRTF